MKTLYIDWLGNCANCNSTLIIVTTEKGSEDSLYEGDQVECFDCGERGRVEADNELAYVVWELEVNDDYNEVGDSWEL